jgi:hypothetical protein
VEDDSYGVPMAGTQAAEPHYLCDELLLPIISTNEIGLWKLVLEIGLDDGVTALTQLGIPRNV